MLDMLACMRLECYERDLLQVPVHHFLGKLCSTKTFFLLLSSRQNFGYFVSKAHAELPFKLQTV